MLVIALFEGVVGVVLFVLFVLFVGVALVVLSVLLVAVLFGMTVGTGSSAIFEKLTEDITAP